MPLTHTSAALSRVVKALATALDAPVRVTVSGRPDLWATVTSPEWADRSTIDLDVTPQMLGWDEARVAGYALGVRQTRQDRAVLDVLSRGGLLFR